MTDESTVEVALNATSAEVELWNEAIKDELLTLREKVTWTRIINPSDDTKALPSHTVLKIK